MLQKRLSEATKKRLRAGRMLRKGKGCAEVALAVGVARQTVYTWKVLLDEGGFDALRAMPGRGRLSAKSKGDVNWALDRISTCCRCTQARSCRRSGITRCAPAPKRRWPISRRPALARVAAQAMAGVLPHEFGVFVRSAGQLHLARAAVKASGMAFKILDDNVETSNGHVSISTMYLAKGLEFRAVVVMACDDEVIPLQERIETVGDDADLQEVYDTERQLLYVACTRARDHLLVTSVEPASEFLDDMQV